MKLLAAASPSSPHEPFLLAIEGDAEQRRSRNNERNWHTPRCPKTDTRYNNPYAAQIERTAADEPDDGDHEGPGDGQAEPAQESLYCPMRANAAVDPLDHQNQQWRQGDGDGREQRTPHTVKKI